MATEVQVVPFQFTAVATAAPEVAEVPVPTAQALVGENAWTCSIASAVTLLGTVIWAHPALVQRNASASASQPAELSELMTPFPTAITSLAGSPLMPVSTHVFSNTLHSPDGSALWFHELPFQWSICGLPESWPAVHTLPAEIAVTALSGT